MSNDILVSTERHLGVLTLNRPQSLNALSLSMIRTLTQQLQAWAEDDNVHAIVIKAVEGKAFCAGGDVRWLYEMGQRHDPLQQQFFIAEYQLNQLIYHYKKPYIALMHGLTMGGGVGISLHGSHRVASESFVFAMPETSIGFFPDIGASYLLSRCQGLMGTYLGLTGNRLNAQQALAQGLITNMIHSSTITQLWEALLGLDLSKDAHHQITRCLAEFSEPAGEAFFAQSWIDESFNSHSMEEIINTLCESNHSWHQETAATLLSKSPLSLKVTLQQLIRASSMDFDACLAMDAVLVNHFTHDHDFYEGVRALLIDKDKRPHWQPKSLAEVSSALVDAYFTLP